MEEDASRTRRLCSRAAWRGAARLVRRCPGRAPAGAEPRSAAPRPRRPPGGRVRARHPRTSSPAACASSLREPPLPLLHTKKSLVVTTKRVGRDIQTTANYSTRKKYALVTKPIIESTTFFLWSLVGRILVLTTNLFDVTSKLFFECI